MSHRVIQFRETMPRLPAPPSNSDGVTAWAKTLTEELRRAFGGQFFYDLANNSKPADPPPATLSTSGSYLAGDGSSLAFLTMSVPAITSGARYHNVLYRRNGAAQWLLAAQIDNTAAVLVRIDDLSTGIAFDVAVQEVSPYGRLGNVVEATGSPFTTPGDTTAPGDPSAIAVRQSGAKIVEIDITHTAPADWAITELYRNTSNDSGTATLIEIKKAKRFHDENVSYGTTYYYWAKVVDLSGNKSGFSPSASHSILVARIVTGDVTDEAITVSGSSKNDASVTITSPAVDLVTLSVDVSASEDVYIFAYALVTGIALASRYVRLQIFRDTTLLNDGMLIITDALNIPPDASSTMLEIDTPGAGTFVYKFKATNAVGDCVATYRRLIVLKRKK